MALRPCSACKRRPHNQKLANLTWAWNRADGVRVAYRQYLCVECYVERVAKLDVARDTDLLICPACGGLSDEDLDPVYATEYVPGRGKAQLELALDGPCAVHVRNRAMEGARLLEDREDQSGGRDRDPGPQTDIPSWDSLGLRP